MDGLVASDSSLGRKLAVRMMESFVSDDGPPDNGLFLRMAEGLLHKFEHAEEIGPLHDENFAEMLNGVLMAQLKRGSNLPRMAGLLPDLLLYRLPDWTPFAVWAHFLISQELKPLVLIDNTPLAIEGEDADDLTFYRVEFRVYPFLKELEE